MPKGYERRKRSASSITAPASRSVTVPRENFSDTVQDIKATTKGRERGQAIAAAAKAKPKKAAAKMTDAERKKRVAAMVRKNRPAIKKMAAARKAKKG
jgi:hypothetical protein